MHCGASCLGVASLVRYVRKPGLALGLELWLSCRTGKGGARQIGWIVVALDQKRSSARLHEPPPGPGKSGLGIEVYLVALPFTGDAGRLKNAAVGAHGRRLSFARPVSPSGTEVRGP